MAGLKIVCMGDSLTRGLGVPADKSWVSRLAEDFKKYDIEVINAGVSGDTTGGMVGRFMREVVDEKPDFVVISGGLNDLLVSNYPDIPQTNLMSMVNISSHHKIMPIIGIVPKPESRIVNPAWARLADYSTWDERMGKYFDWMRLFVRTFRIPCIDFDRDYEPWKQGKPDSEVYASDGMHVSVPGHAVMYETAKATFRSLLRGNVEIE